MKTTDRINYIADEGKVFVRKSDGEVMGFGLGLGSSDSIENYDEVECPSDYKGIEGYDNTISDEGDEAVIDFVPNKYVS